MTKRIRMVPHSFLVSYPNIFLHLKIGLLCLLQPKDVIRHGKKDDNYANARMIHVCHIETDCSIRMSLPPSLTPYANT